MAFELFKKAANMAKESVQTVAQAVKGDSLAKYFPVPKGKSLQDVPEYVKLKGCMEAGKRDEARTYISGLLDSMIIPDNGNATKYENLFNCALNEFNVDASDEKFLEYKLALVKHDRKVKEQQETDKEKEKEKKRDKTIKTNLDKISENSENSAKFSEEFRDNYSKGRKSTALGMLKDEMSKPEFAQLNKDNYKYFTRFYNIARLGFNDKEGTNEFKSRIDAYQATDEYKSIFTKPVEKKIEVKIIKKGVKSASKTSTPDASVPAVEDVKKMTPAEASVLAKEIVGLYLDVHCPSNINEANILIDHIENDRLTEAQKRCLIELDRYDSKKRVGKASSDEVMFAQCTYMVLKNFNDEGIVFTDLKQYTDFADLGECGSCQSFVYYKRDKECPTCGESLTNTKDDNVDIKATAPEIEIK